jgi:hypothetical protein
VDSGPTWSTGTDSVLARLTGGKGGRCTVGWGTDKPGWNSGDLGGRGGGHNSWEVEGVRVTTDGVVVVAVVTSATLVDSLLGIES